MKNETRAAPAHSKAYLKLRKMVLFGELAPKQAVTIQGLTQALDAGMTPVREALRRLISEGALVQEGNRRVCVPELTHTGALELGFMRETLEPKLAFEAAKRMQNDVFDTLVGIDKLLDEAIRQGDIAGYLTQNYRFHAAIYQTADAPIIAETVDRLWLRFGPSLRVVCGRSGTQNLPDKHADLLDALRRADPDAAAHAMKADVAQGIEQICSAYPLLETNA